MKIATDKTPPPNDPEFDGFVEIYSQRFAAKLGEGQLFTTNAAGLYEAFLNAIPEDRRQHYRCNCCRKFIENYGGLARIDETGKISSAVWDEPAVPMFKAMQDLVEAAKITGVFYSKEKVWGVPQTGSWTHLALTPPSHCIHTSLVKEPHQDAAEKLEDYKNVKRALAEFTKPTIEQALTLLRSDALYRSEKVLGQAEWLLKLHLIREDRKDYARNLIWKQIALAPAGFCHPRSSMIGTLLEDIAAGLDFGEVSRKFKAKMSPTQYMRPQAAPKAGNIAQAEKIIEKLAAAGALRRRYAKFEDVQTIWVPKAKEIPPADEKGGVFGHLKAKGKEALKPLIAPAQTMTWEKFARTVLPDADAIYFTPTFDRRNYCALVAAEDPAAPPILQWDDVDLRNTVSWYVYHGGSSPADWSLTAGKKVKVSGITLKPCMWNDGSERFVHQGKGVVFLLEGAKENGVREPGIALFPEILKSELHEIRATIEAYSKSAKISGREESSACGLLLAAGSGSWEAAQFEVERAGQITSYKLDRWD